MFRLKINTFQIRVLFVFLLFGCPHLTVQNQHISQGNRGLKRAVYQQGVSNANFAVQKYKYLQGSPLGSSCEVEKLSECALICVNSPSCFSLNLAALPNDKGKLRCELLSEDKHRSPDKLVLSQQFHHYSIKVGNQIATESSIFSDTRVLM